jgi:hypothetical protein
MPKTVNVDEERVAGAIDYVIKGRKWRAEEPSIDLFKQVLAMSPPPPPPGSSPEDEKQQTIDAMDTLLPQLIVLLADPEDPDTHPTEEDLSTLSVKRAGKMLGEILGEGPAATTGGGTTR